MGLHRTFKVDNWGRLRVRCWMCMWYINNMCECDDPEAQLTQQQAHCQQQRADDCCRQFGWRCRLFGCPLTAVVCVHTGADAHRKHLVGWAGVTLSIGHLHLQLIHTRPQIVTGVESSGCLWTQRRRWTNSIFDLTKSFRCMLSCGRQGRKCQKYKVHLLMEFAARTNCI